MRTQMGTLAIALCLGAFSGGNLLADEAAKSDDKEKSSVKKSDRAERSRSRSRSRSHGDRAGRGSSERRAQALLARFDRDGDGKLDARELDRLLRAQQARTAGPHAHAWHRGGRGPAMHHGFHRAHGGHRGYGWHRGHGWHRHPGHHAWGFHRMPHMPPRYMAGRYGRPPHAMGMRDGRRDEARSTDRRGADRPSADRRGPDRRDSERRPGRPGSRRPEAAAPQEPAAEAEATETRRRPERTAGRGRGPGGADQRERFRQMMLERFDKDGDGQLSDEEREAAREQMREFRARQAERGRPARPASRERGERSRADTSRDNDD